MSTTDAVPADYNYLKHQLDRVSLFDLFRLYTEIGEKLNDQQKLDEIGRQLRKGMQVEWFSPKEKKVYQGVNQRLILTPF